LIQDDKYVSGESVPVDYHSNEEATAADILYTFEKRLYMYERHTYKQMVYTLPVRRGKVTLVLKFAEVNFLQCRCTSLKLDRECSISRLGLRLLDKTLTLLKKQDISMLLMRSTSRSMSVRMVSTLRGIKSKEDSALLAIS
jgi:hypothetical protein